MFQVSLVFEAVIRTSRIVSRSIQKISIGIALSAGLIAPSLAQDLILTPGLSPNSTYINQTGFEQIDTYTRALRLSFVDVHLPGNGGFDLKLYRTYDSRAKGDVFTRPFSHGWSMHMGYLSFTDYFNTPSLCFYSRALNNFQVTLQTPQGETAQLLESDLPNAPSLFSNRWKLDCSRTNSGKIVLMDTEGSTYEMRLIGNSINGDKRLWMTTRIIDRHGNWASIEYRNSWGVYDYGNSSVSQISRIITSDGRVVSFNFEGGSGDCSADETRCADRLKSITAAGQTHTYQYCTISRAGFEPGIGLETMLIGVVRPDSTRWQFAYHGGAAGFCDRIQASNAPGQKYDWGLTKVTTPQGGEVNYTYVDRRESTHYFNTVPSDISNFWQLGTRSTTGTNAGNWTYSTTAGSYNGIATLDTTVSGPDGSSIFKHTSHSTASHWLNGLLLSKQTGSVQTE